MGTLMIFHWKNFQSGSLFSYEPKFASIKNEEFYFFTDHEIDTIDLAEKSPRAINYGIQMLLKEEDDDRDARTNNSDGEGPEPIDHVQ